MITKHEGIHTDTAATQNTTSPIDENIVSAVTSDQLQTFSKIINSEDNKYTDEKTLNVLLSGIIDQDYLFLITKQGRPRRTDRFMNHLCHYGLKGASTGVEEYNKLFKQIKGLALAVTQPGMILKKEYMDRLRQVIAIHNEHCPDDPVTLDVPV